MRALRYSIIGTVLLAGSLLAGAEADVGRVLDEQVAAWNQGDLERFAATYDEAAVMAGKPPTRGRAAILERYRKHYPSRSRMGTLSFSDLEVQSLSVDYASVMGRWRLARGAAEGGDTGGIFTLLVKRTPAGWQIVLDHTS